MKEYDYSLDAIKGISCILMIVAHIPLYFNGNERVFQIIAGLAPVLSLLSRGDNHLAGSKEKLQVAA